MDTELSIPILNQDSGFHGEHSESTDFEIEEESGLVSGQQADEAPDDAVVEPEAAPEVNSSEIDHRQLWDKQWLTKSVSQDLLGVVKAVLLNGPDRDLLGIRTYPDLETSNDPPGITLCIAEQNEMDQTIYTDLFIPVEPSTYEEAADIWPLVEHNIERDWPEEMPAAEQPWLETTALDPPGTTEEIDNQDGDRARFIYMAALRRHPGHFMGDWSFFKDTSVALAELSFTPLGFPSVEFFRDQTGLFPNLRRGRADVFGRSWTIRPSSRIMPWRIFAFALSQVALGHDLELEGVAKCATAFTKRYTCPWPTTAWTNWCCVGNTMFHAQFHTRYWSIKENTITLSDAEPTCSGLRFERDFGRTLGFESIPEFPIIETRSSVAIIASLWQRHPHYTMVTLTDTATFNLNCIAQQKLWTSIGLEMCDESGGVAIFQAAIGGLITEWGQQWAVILGRITATSTYEVRDILDLSKLDLKSSKLESKAWYALRQLLFESQDIIKELSRDLHSLADDLDRSISVVTSNPTLSANWKALLAYHDKIEANLLRHVQHKLAALDIFAQACTLKVLEDVTEPRNHADAPMDMVWMIAFLIMGFLTYIY